MFEELISKYGVNLANEYADDIIKVEIGKKFQTCLEPAGVFKQTEAGLAAFEAFMIFIGSKREGICENAEEL